MDTGRQTRNVQEAGIIVYPDWRRTRIYLLVCAGSALLPFLFFLLLLFLMMFFPVFRHGDTLFLALLMGSLGTTGLWCSWTLVQFLSLGAPTLVISHQGIRVGSVYGPSEIELPWEDIEAIVLMPRGLVRQLAIRPRKGAVCLSRFSVPMRFMLLLNIVSGALIVLPQPYLEQPVENILYRVRKRYKKEIRYYHIDLSTYPSR